MIAIAHVGLGLFVSFAPTLGHRLAGNSIRLESGHAYATAIPRQALLVYVVQSDTMTRPAVSRLRLLEDGKPLGPPHTSYERIKDDGGGAFLHWENGYLVFSTPDGTDPRTNGRRYSIDVPLAPNPAVVLLVLLVLAALDIGLFLIFRNEIVTFGSKIVGFGRVHRKILLTAAVGAVVIPASLGTFGTVVVASAGEPKDAHLVASVVLHALLGCTVCAACWAAGAGVVMAIARDRHAPIPQILIPAFPVGIVLLTILVSLALVVPYGKAVALLAWMTCLAPLGGWRPQRFSHALACALAILPFAIAFGVWMGLLWHGPTETLSGSPSSNLVYYAGISWSLAAQPFPFTNLGHEGGGAVSYFNMLFSALGATMVDAPGFDAVIFIAAGGAASYVALTAFMVHLYFIDRPPERMEFFNGAILLLAVLAAARYPYWVIESIPLVFIPALTIAVWWMTERGRADARWTLLAMAAGVVGTALTKVGAAVTLVPLAVGPLLERLGASPRRVRVLAIAIASAFLLYAAYMLHRFMPAFLAIFGLGPESLQVEAWTVVLRDLTIPFLVLLAWRATGWPVALAIAAGLVSFLAFPALFRVNFVCATLLLGLMLAARPPQSAGLRALAVVAFVCALPAATLLDPAGVTSGLAWTLCLGGAVWVAWTSALPAARRSVHVARSATAFAGWMAASVTAVALVGVARGHVIADSGFHPGKPELTPELREIWLAVRQRTPPDSLIFVDQTRTMHSLLGGQNSYARAGRRQIFVADYIADLPMRIDEGRRRAVLDVNESVLRGTIRPSALATQRRYGSYFAVLPKSRPPAARWSTVHENGSYALYRIPD